MLFHLLLQFNVERRNNIDTRVEINCANKSSLLLSTLTTLDALGLEPQQCVISCFNDFAMQASCCEVIKFNHQLLTILLTNNFHVFIII